MNIKEQMEILREARINEIINDESIPKLDKLRLFGNEKLFDYASYTQEEFIEWERDAKEQYKNGGGSGSAMTDTIFAPSVNEQYEKYENVSYPEALEAFFENYEYELDDDKLADFDGKYTVVTCRSSDIKIQKTKQEIIDAVYNFCITNKIIGFKNDW